MFDVVNNTLQQNKMPIVLGFIGVVLLVAGVTSSGILKYTSNKPLVKQAASTIAKSDNAIRVDISGQVAHPGVYSFSKEDRIEQALQAAGGVTEKADPEYIVKQINLAQHLTDGMKIYIPSRGESPIVGAQTVLATTTASGGIININQASASELDTLSGVGPTTAQKIIAGRPYQSTEELVSKKVVSRAVFLKIKDTITAP
jgi:competence protein ComEA